METPLVVTWECTQACGLTCDHCRADAQPDRHADELTTAEGKQLIDTVTDFGSPSPILVFSGGDPLERPDLFELLEYAHTAGLRTAVAPAPTERLKRDVLERLADTGVHQIALSLDGATAKRHDEFRGESGSFATVKRAAEYANSIDLRVQINTTVTQRTLNDLPGIADLVADFDAVMWEVFFLVPIGRGADLEQISPLEAERTLEWLYRRQKEEDFRLITVEAPHYRRVAQACTDSDERPKVGSTGDGNGFVFIGHTGDIFPSGFLLIPAGNVRTENLVEVYQEGAIFQFLRKPNTFTGRCGECQYRSECGGSRARAYAACGSPFASDPLCIYTEQ
ncbi:radical SAM protein [Halobacterium hubeiense]|nr:radical SAM protein [Halobacterium hubeiense]